MSDDVAMQAEVTELTENVKGLRKSYEEEAVKRDQRIRGSERAVRWAFGLAGFALLVAAVAVIGVVLATTDAHSAHRQADRAQHSLVSYKASRTKAFFTNCYQANIQIDRNKMAFKDTASLLVAQASHPTDAQRAVIASYLKATAAKADDDFPFRDCSPAAARKGVVVYLTPTTTGTP